MGQNLSWCQIERLGHWEGDLEEGHRIGFALIENRARTIFDRKKISFLEGKMYRLEISG